MCECRWTVQKKKAQARPLTDRGATGTPSHDLDEAPPSVDQEANRVVSGGGVVGDQHGPSHKVDQSR
jgi:hypothetical protein